jgi:hypothetical protein
VTQPIPGTAYIPDGGSGSRFGVQVIRFEGTDGNLLPSPGLPAFVTFPESVGPLAFASDGSTSLSADAAGSSGPFTHLQDIFGVNTASITPVGTAYDVAQGPTAAPTPVAQASPTIGDVTGLAVIGTGFASIGLAVGSGGDGIVGVSSLTNAPPAYAQVVPFSDSAYTVNPSAAPSPGTRNNIIVSGDAAEALVRGADLIAFTVRSAATGYEFNATAYSAALGTHPSVLRGRGGMAFDPAAGDRALVLQAPGVNDVTLVNGLPGAIGIAATVTLPSRPHTVTWTPDGASAVVGADGGYYLFSGMGSNALTLASQTPMSPTFTGCDGNVGDHLASVLSAAISSDARYLLLFGPSTATTCGGTNGTLIALPFVPPGTNATPTPAPSPSATPAPSMFVQNGLITPATDQDYMVVR